MAGDGDARVALVWDDRLATYDLGSDHPLAPIRVELTVALIRDLGLTALDHVEEVVPGPGDRGLLETVHRPAYVDAVTTLSADPALGAGAAVGLGPGDTPAFAGMHEASMQVCAATVEAARRVLAGEAVHAFSPAGGLHHAMPHRAAGFCVYNDPAVAIRWLLDHGAERVAYVDVDVHHGDGVEFVFADDPRVLTISLHESGRFLFPGTGAADDTGGLSAPGSAVNVPLHPGTTGPIWLAAFDAVVPDLVAAFAPDVLVTQLGCDTHLHDPLAHLALTVDDQLAAVARLHALAHDVCGGRWVATGGGGYRLVDVVPRTWAGAFSEMVGAPLPLDTPVRWRERVATRTVERPPTSFTDDPAPVRPELVERARRAADEAVATVRRLVHRTHGL